MHHSNEPPPQILQQKTPRDQDIVRKSKHNPTIRKKEQQKNTENKSVKSDFVPQIGTALRITILVGSIRTLSVDVGLYWPR